MSTPDHVIDDLAHTLIVAEERTMPIEPISTRYPELTEADVYRVQTALLDLKTQRGDRVVGKKVGATSQAALQLFGLSEPFYGSLLAAGRVPDGGTIPAAQLIHPRVECEIAFQLGQPLRGPDISAADVLAATAALLPAFEIVDARTSDWKLQGMRELIADNGVVSRYVLGEGRTLDVGLDLRNVTAVLTKNGEQVAEGQGTAVLGDPATAVAWLVNKLATHTQHLAAGDIILAGSLTPLHPVQAGDQFTATFAGIGSVAVTFE
jgi:2-keto-4-pentenoate hydratase